MAQTSGYMTTDDVVEAFYDGVEIFGIFIGTNFIWPDPWVDVWDEGSAVIWEPGWRDMWSVTDSLTGDPIKEPANGNE